MPFIMRLPLDLTNIIKRAGTVRATSSIIKSGQKDTEASITISRTTLPFVAAHLEILHCAHHPVIPESDLYFTFCSTLNALS